MQIVLPLAITLLLTVMGSIIYVVSQAAPLVNVLLPF
jgi:hypothetical protein